MSGCSDAQERGRTGSLPRRRQLLETSALQQHPWVAVDVVIFTIDEDRLKALLVKIKGGPLAGAWAFPGGLVAVGESLEEAALRELHEKTPIRGVYLEQLFTFGSPNRNPTAHVVSTAYWALIPRPTAVSLYGSKYADAAWWNVHHLPDLAYDHRHVAAVALERLRAKVEYTNVVYSLLPRHFTLSEIQRIYEIIRGRSLDRRNFRKKLLTTRLLKPLERVRRGPHRPAALYTFRARKLRPIELF